MLEEDCQLTVRKLESNLKIWKCIVCKFSEFIPKSSTVEQSNHFCAIAQDNLEVDTDNENVFKKIMTGNEL